MERHLEIARENWEIFFSFLGKDYDQRDHYDDHSPGMNMSFLHLLSSFCPLESTSSISESNLTPYPSLFHH